jgi:RNA polymerase sigma-70 factor (ECF subfamily)
MTPRFDLDTLLAETRWLGGLARQLVARSHDAEDLVQETLRTAIERPPAADRPLRGWLRTVLLSRSRDTHRSERARAVREQQAKPDVAAPATIDVVVKAEVHGELVAAVLSLEEPYRSCLLLRYFENLRPREIARLCSVPVATVHSRLQRALALLRTALARSHGHHWRLALAPLLRLRLAPSLLLGVPLVNALAKLTLSAAAVAVAVLVWQWPTAASLERRDETAALPPNVAAAVSPPGAATAAAPLERAPAPTAATATTPAETTPSQRLLRGRVVDVRGTGIAGVQLAVHTAGARGGARDGEALRALSNLGGAFELAVPPGADTVVAVDPRWATVLAGSARVEPDKQSTVVIAPRIELAGRVVDATGTPLPGAALTVHLPSHLGADLGILLDYSITQHWRTSCDNEGRFRLRDVPAVPDASLSASLGGYLPSFQPIPAATNDLLELVLERPQRGSTIVEGLVVDTWGSFVAGARVSAGAAISISDARGAFTIDLGKDRDLARLVAVAAGMQPAVLVPARDASGKPDWPARVVLQLGGPPLALRGRVLDRDGHPVAGAKVWIADPLFVGWDHDALLAETMLGRKDRPFWAFVVTDEAGAFRIDGLAERAYVVRALEPSTLAAVTQEGVPAGSENVELRLTTAMFAELRGRVVARDGSPIAGVGVKQQRPAHEVQIADGTRDQWAVGASMRTNARGEFTFANVPTEGVEVCASGDEIMFAGRMIEPGIDPLAFVLQVDRRMHLQVELAPPTDRADRVRVLDAAGVAMLLRIMRGETARTNRVAEIVDGRSEILSLGEGAVTAVFLRRDVEVGRMPLQLAAKQVNTIRW